MDQQPDHTLDTRIIIAAGANARGMGRSLLDNPYLHQDRVPMATGESLEVWESRHDAWEAGWLLEDSVRSQ